MKIVFVITVLLSILFIQATFHSAQLVDSVEAQAMASLGYTVTKKINSYPEDKYAMPEPYSSERLFVYKYTGKADKFTEKNYLAGTK